MTKTATKTNNKKELRLEVKNQLTQSLSKWKDLLGEKKFNNKIKEATKSFSKGLKTEQAATPTAETKPAKAPKVKKEKAVAPVVAEKKASAPKEKKAKAAVVEVTEIKAKEEKTNAPAKKEASKKTVSK